MTGYASAGSARGAWSWTWELRAVNGRGLEIRVRAPDWMDGLEPEIRKAIQEVATRGTISVGLRMQRVAPGDQGPTEADDIDRILERIVAVEQRAAARGMPLAPCRASDILALGTAPREGAIPPDDIAELRRTLLRHLRATVLTDFAAMRASEGAALAQIMNARLAEIEDLVAAAATQAAARQESAAGALRAALDRISETIRVDPDRMAQELALLATRTDVTEEIDRLRTHAAAARDLIAQDAPAGRELNFLMQEFNREANTLCAKSQDAALTRTGLALKTAIEQMREQVQNVE